VEIASIPKLPLLLKLKVKYRNFFDADWRWSLKNLQEMQKTPHHYQRWWKVAQPLLENLGRFDILPIETDFDLVSNGATFTQIVDRLFEKEWTRIKHDLSSQISLESEEVLLKRGFGTWAIGQLMLFQKYGHHPDSAYCESLLIDELKDLKGEWDFDRIARWRQIFEAHLKKLSLQKYLTENDRKVYKELTPFYPPTYVQYDAAKVSEEQFRETVHEIMDFQK